MSTQLGFIVDSNFSKEDSLFGGLQIMALWSHVANELSLNNSQT